MARRGGHGAQSVAGVCSGKNAPLAPIQKSTPILFAKLAAANVVDLSASVASGSALVGTATAAT